MAARGSATVYIGPLPVNFQAGFFAGHACSLDPLIYVDPDVVNALPNATSFTGVYIQYGGSLSLSQLLLGEADCALDVEALISTQQYLQGGPGSVTIGFRQKEGVDVSLLCCISGSATLILDASGTIGPARTRSWTCSAQPNFVEVSARARSAFLAAKHSPYLDRSTKKASPSTSTTNARRYFTV